MNQSSPAWNARAVGVALAALAVVACKGEVKEVDNPDTLAALDQCRAAAKQQDDYIKSLNARVMALESASTGEIVVAVSGDAFTISGGKGPNERVRPSGGREEDEKLYRAFLDEVNKSRAAMKKCYQGALKKNTALQAKPVDLDVEVRFTTAGAVSSARFNPRISDAFELCMTTIAKRWQVQGASSSVTFKQRVTLTPQ